MSRMKLSKIDLSACMTFQSSGSLATQCTLSPKTTPDRQTTSQNSVICACGADQMQVHNQNDFPCMWQRQLFCISFFWSFQKTFRILRNQHWFPTITMFGWSMKEQKWNFIALQIFFWQTKTWSTGILTLMFCQFEAKVHWTFWSCPSTLTCY